jgi:hypothetical protein
VSLLVTPKQANAVTLAKELGILSLTLRRPGDVAEEITDGETVQTLLALEGESAYEKKRQRPDEPDGGLSEWLTNNAPPAPPAVAVAQPPAPVVEVQPPKFVMTIRTQNGDRKYNFKEMDSEPEEVTDEPPPAPAAAPAAAPTATTPTFPPQLPAGVDLPFNPPGNESTDADIMEPAPDSAFDETQEPAPVSEGT